MNNKVKTMFSIGYIINKLLNLWIILISSLILTSTNVNAFKVDTHVWVGQQVINDLEDDGAISIYKGDELVTLPVKTDVRDEILNNKAYYLQGNIGPDAVPGIYSGQMTIHPGSDNGGWGTGEWLEHLLSKAELPHEKAFAYGFLGHAATDLFAHTYVNQYAGDTFVLSDGETLVEQRHFLLESYISQYLPPLSNSQGVSLGNIADLINKNGKPAVPNTFLWKAFVEDKKAADEFKANGSPHLAAVHHLYAVLGNLTKEGGVIDETHKTVQQLLIKYFFDIDVSKEDLEKFNKFHQKLHDYTDKEIDKIRKFHLESKQMVLDTIGKGNNEINKSLESTQQLIEKINSLQAQKHRVEKDVLNLLIKLNRTEKKLCHSIIVKPCERICLIPKPWPLKGCLTWKITITGVQRSYKDNL